MKQQTKFSFLLTFCFQLIAFSLFSQDYPLAVETYKLDNGLTVYLNPDHSNPTIFGAVAVNAGSKHDPADATGIAHYLEHMLFKGTTTLGTSDFEKEKPHLDSIIALYDQLGETIDDAKRKAIQTEINNQSKAAAKYSLANEFDNLLKSIGSTRVNAFTNDEMTFYYNVFPPNQAEKWLDIYAHRFQNPVFRTFQAELEVVYEEKNRAMDNFGRTIIEKFNGEFYKNHPYGQQSTLGTVEHLKNPSLQKMYDFFNTYYVANNMALILTGDFEPEEVKPMIEAKFGALKQREVPDYPVYEEKPFAGKEVLKMRAAPIKLGAIGFRAVAKGHPDEIGLEVLNYFLFNEGETGLLNQLVLENKLMFAGSFPSALKDHGGTILFYVPKIIGQSLGKAEKLVFEQLDLLKKGEFDEKLLNASKNEMTSSFKSYLESGEDRGTAIGDVFVNGQSWEDYLAYPDKIEKITKEDVVRLANKYLGDNYLMLRSGRGFPKKTKLDKPGFKPVLPKEGVSSSYANSFKKIPEKKTPPKFVDFESDILWADLSNKNRLYYSPNPINDLFELDIIFEIGEEKIPGLDIAAQLFNYSGTESKNLQTLKTQFQSLGCTYFASSTPSYFTINLSGNEKNVSQALDLLGELMEKPIASGKNLKTVINQETTNRKINEREPSFMGNVLLSYGLYRFKSPYLNRSSNLDLKGYTPDSLVNLLSQARTYQAKIHYSGNENGSLLADMLEKKLPWTLKPKPGTSPYVRPIINYGENQVLLLNNKRAVQSQVYFYVHGDEYKKEDAPYINAFNAYFGGGFSGLVLQEIREYRSLAYSAGGNYSIPPIFGQSGKLITYVGCQVDKTQEAIEVMIGLLKDMPEKEDRMELIRSNLRQKVYTGKPNFRKLTQTYERWKTYGYEEDPRKAYLPVYENMTFKDISEFYYNKIKGKPITIMIVGDKRRLDMEKLKEFGKIIELSNSDIIKN